MAEEESFVILGSSPLPSLRDDSTPTHNIIGNDGHGSFSSLNRSEILNETKKSLTPTQTDQAITSRNATESMKTDLREAATSDLTVKPDDKQESKKLARENPLEHTIKLISSCSIDETNSNSITDSIKSNESAKSISKPAPLIGNKQPNSLGPSLIMGEINADVLKTSVYSQFPSICSMEACAEDVVKLQTIITEYYDLKQTMVKVSDTMRQSYYQNKQFKENCQMMETQYKQQMQECQTEIAALREHNMRLTRNLDECQSQIAAIRNLNIELVRNLEEQKEQVRIVNEIHKKDNDKLVQCLSEKTAQINNMRTVIEKLEEQQMNSFDYLPKPQFPATSAKTEYVTSVEHECVIRTLEEKIKLLETENDQLKQMKPNYIDELNYLGVKLASAEELIKKFRVDINMLQSKDIEKCEMYKNYSIEREEMRQEINLLRQQVEVYSKDFEMERNSRQQLATEKSNLLQDIRALQRRNQELIEEAERHVQRFADYASGAGVANAIAARTTTSGTSAAIKAEATNAIRAQSPSYNHPQRAMRNLTPLNETYSSGVGQCPICAKQFSSLAILQSHASNCFD